MNRRALVPCLAAAAVVLPAGVARADQTPGEAIMSYRYAVTVEGTADYARHVDDPVGNGVATEDTNVHLGWTAQIPVFQFFGTMPTGGAGNLDGDAAVSIDYRTSVPEATYTDTGECTSGVLDAGASSLAISNKSSVKGYVIDANVLGATKIKLGSCSGALEHLDGSVPMGRNTQEDGAEPWAASFDMPPEAVGQGKIIQLLDKTVTGVDCPGHRPGTTSCTLTWHARLTFVKTGEDLLVWSDDPDSLVVPIPTNVGPAPAAAPPSAAPLAAGALDTIFGALRKLAKLSGSGAAATMPVSCPAGCTGTVTATPGAGARATSAAHPGPAAGRTLGRARFTIKPGATRKVTLRFGPSARRAIRRAGGVRIAVRLQIAGGPAQTRTLSLRLPR